MASNSSNQQSQDMDDRIQASLHKHLSLIIDIISHCKYQYGLRYVSYVYWLKLEPRRNIYISYT